MKLKLPTLTRSEMIGMPLLVALFWCVVGGQRFTCEGTAEAWTCALRSETPALRVLGLAEKYRLDGPDDIRSVTVVRRRNGRFRGWSAALTRSDGERFDMGMHRWKEDAEADRQAMLDWVADPSTPLVLRSPALRAWFPWFWTTVLVVGYATTFYAHLQRGRRRQPGGQRHGRAPS